MDFVNQLASSMELNASVCEFIYRLLELAYKTKSSFTRTDLRYAQLTNEFVRSKADANGGSHSANFIQALRQL
jgi:hypothetical protein